MEGELGDRCKIRVCGCKKYFRKYMGDKNAKYNDRIIQETRDNNIKCVV